MGQRHLVESNWPPLRQWWQEINRHERQAQTELRTKRKSVDQKRAKCRCDAYKFPHRPGGGLCRHPDPPAVRWQDSQAATIAARAAEVESHFGEMSAEQIADLASSVTKPPRPYRTRYAGILRQIARNSGLHPIRDRALIERLMPHVVATAKQIKSQHRRAKYRNMEIVEASESNTVVRGVWTSAGPTM